MRYSFFKFINTQFSYKFTLSIRNKSLITTFTINIKTMIIRKLIYEISPKASINDKIM